MKNKKFSVITGITIGFLVVFSGENLMQTIFSTTIFPNPQDKIAMENFLKTVPNSLLFYLLIIWALSAFLGGMTAGKLAKNNWKRASLYTGVILLLGNIVNFIMIPHPMWVNITSLLMYLPLSLLGGRIVNSDEETEEDND